MKENYFLNKVVVVTGGAHGIGQEIINKFLKCGAKVATIDLNDNFYFKGDLANKETLEKFALKVLNDFGHVDFLINNAAPLSKGISSATYEDFEYALKVGVTAPFYLTKLFKDHFKEGSCVINISSTREKMSQPETESYSASKGGIGALTHALAVSLAGIARVNAISPGWIDTTNTTFKGADAKQHLVKRVGKPEDIANMVLFLCSDEASFITGENITIDGGMSKLMIYHNDFNWELKD